MAKDQGIVQTALRRRTSLVAAASRAGAPPAPAKKRANLNPIQFLREVRAEARKVTWTSWKETWITSVMVAIMVILTAMFFFAIDWILSLGVTGILRLANAQ